MIKVLMVCLGNICRSPMAEGVLAHLVKEAQLDGQVSVDSAGTGSYHVDETVHPNTLATLKKHGIAYHGRARQFWSQDMTTFDYVLGMDASNLANIRRYEGTAETNLFLHYANVAGATTEAEVPDPYSYGIDRYEAVFELVMLGNRALLNAIRSRHNL